MHGANESLLLTLWQAETEQALATLNDVGARYGLRLTSAELARIDQARRDVLLETGRIEFGQSVVEKLVYAFCDSPYIQPDEWADTLIGLQEAFYYFKGEAMERISDDELVSYMQAVFDGPAQGDLSYLTGSSLEALCRLARGGASASAWTGEGETEA